MASFSDYLRILDRTQPIRSRGLSEAIRADRGLADWQRNALLMQIGIRARSVPGAANTKPG